VPVLILAPSTSFAPGAGSPISGTREDIAGPARDQVIPASTVNEMLTDGIGWFSYAGNFALTTIRTAALQRGDALPEFEHLRGRLAEGYDMR